MGLAPQPQVGHGHSWEPGLDLAPEQPRARTRGAAHDAFDLVFTLPFDEKTVQGYVAHEPETTPGPDGIDSDTFGKPGAVADRAGDGDASGAPSARRVIGFGALGLGAVAAGIGATYGVLGVRESNSGSPTESQRDAASRNDRITRDRTASMVGLGVGGALIATGVVVLLWPSAPKALRGASALVAPAGASLGVGGTF